MPIESWRSTQRKRTISTKTGLPPVSSTRISSKLGETEKSKPAVTLIQVTALADGVRIGHGIGQGRGPRKVTFANMNSQTMM